MDNIRLTTQFTGMKISVKSNSLMFVNLSSGILKSVNFAVQKYFVMSRCLLHTERWCKAKRILSNLTSVHIKNRIPSLSQCISINIKIQNENLSLSMILL